MTLLCPHCHKPYRPLVDPLTPRQLQAFRWIEHFTRLHGIAPSLLEIATALRLRSVATVREHLSELERKGALSRDPTHARSITLLVRSDELT